MIWRFKPRAAPVPTPAGTTLSSDWIINPLPWRCYSPAGIIRLRDRHEAMDPGREFSGGFYARRDADPSWHSRRHQAKGQNGLETVPARGGLHGCDGLRCLTSPLCGIIIGCKTNPNWVCPYAQPLALPQLSKPRIKRVNLDKPEPIHRTFTSKAHEDQLNDVVPRYGHGLPPTLCH